MNIKDKLKISTDTRNFIISFLFASSLAYLLTFTNVWQLIIIPGIIAGMLNKTMRRGIYSAALSVFVVWFIFMVYQMASNNAYKNLDQFAGLIFGGSGYGVVIFIIVILLGILFGALGGTIGSGFMILIRARYEKSSLKTTTTNKEKIN